METLLILPFSLLLLFFSPLWLLNQYILSLTMKVTMRLKIICFLVKKRVNYFSKGYEEVL